MTLSEAGGMDARRQLLSAWEHRCRESGFDPAPCSSPDALYLISALSVALQSGTQTSELGRAARSWGARFTAPVEALAALAALREVVLEATAEPREGAWARDLPVATDSVSHVVDQLMLEAVDAASAKLRALARTDPLTGSANRLALREDLGHSVRSAARSGLDLALAAIDLDGLKGINDTNGHAAGDAALKDLVARLRSALRDADQLYRTGGDEFVAVAPFTDEHGATAMLERASEGEGPSFSWGVASLRKVGHRAIEDPDLLLAAADADLYSRRRRAREAQDADNLTDETTPEVLEARRKLSETKKAEALGVASAIPLGLSRESADSPPPAANPRRRLWNLLAAIRSTLFGAKHHRMALVAIIASLMMATAVVAAPNHGLPPTVNQYAASASPGAQLPGAQKPAAQYVRPATRQPGGEVVIGAPPATTSSGATSTSSGSGIPLSPARSDVPKPALAILTLSGHGGSLDKSALPDVLNEGPPSVVHVDIAQSLGIAATPVAAVTHLTGSSPAPLSGSSAPTTVKVGLPSSATSTATGLAATSVPSALSGTSGSGTTPGGSLPTSVSTLVGPTPGTTATSTLPPTTIETIPTPTVGVGVTSSSPTVGVTDPAGASEPVGVTATSPTVGVSTPSTATSAPTTTVTAPSTTVTATTPATVTPTVPQTTVTATTPSTTVTATTPATTTSSPGGSTAATASSAATSLLPQVPAVTPPEITDVATSRQASSTTLDETGASTL